MMRFRTKGRSLQYLVQLEPFKNKMKLVGDVFKYKSGGLGPLTTTVVESFGFLRSDDAKLFPGFPTIVDSTSGNMSPDIELCFVPFIFGDDPAAKVPPGEYLTIIAVLLRPTSVGSITLQSSDPAVQPVINPNYLATPHDIEVFVRAIKAVRQIVASEPLASAVDLSTPHHPNLDNAVLDMTDVELGEFVREKVLTIFHPVSSARMAPLENGGVVDPQLRVHGVPNLRVVDASIMPSIPSGHTSAPTLAIAEKASDMIKFSLKVA